MRGVYLKILEELDSRKLVEIIKLGKYSIRGFRLEGGNTPQKRNAMIRELLNAKNLNGTLKKYARNLVDEKKINNIWTYPNILTVEEVQEKIEKYTKERIFLELLSNERENLIQEYFLQFGEDKNLNAVSNKENEEFNSDIKNLRAIISMLEEDKVRQETAKERVDKDNQDLRGELENLKELNARQKNKEAEMSKELINYKSKIEELNIEVKELKELLDYHRGRGERQGKEIKSLQRIKVLVLGGGNAKDWFEYVNKTEQFQFSFEKSILDKSFFAIDEIWVIRSLLSNRQFRNVEDTGHFNKMRDLARVRYFFDFYEIEKYMIQVEELYYAK